MKTTEREVLPGIFLRAVETERFKTGSFAVTFLTKLRKETASEFALIPFLLRRGCRALPSLEKINFELDYLYGASVEPLVYKQGDVQYLGFICSGLDDAYVDLAEPMSKSLLKMVRDLLLDPLLENGHFRTEYFKGEKEQLINAVLAEKNEKLSYAYQRTCTKLFPGQGFGVSAMGEAKYAQNLTEDGVFSAYQSLLKSAPLVVTYCGSTPFDAVAEAVAEAFSGFARDVVRSAAVSNPEFIDERQECCEVMDVAQTVLLVGLESDAPELPTKVLSTILGGGTASKLFLEVRERASLCYYTGAVFQPHQKSLCMYAGVEDEKTSLACEKMLQQLELCASGEISDEELSRAKNFIVHQMKVTQDTSGALLSYWIDRAVDPICRTPEETATAICEISKEQVIRAAKSCKVKLIYRLCGKEASCCERKLLPEHS